MNAILLRKPFYKTVLVLKKPPLQIVRDSGIQHPVVGICKKVDVIGTLHDFSSSGLFCIEKRIA
jgi:hypothetical protein